MTRRVILPGQPPLMDRSHALTTQGMLYLGLLGKEEFR